VTVDWSKPIQLEDGELCELVDTNEAGWDQWGARKDGALPTRHILRLGVDTSTTGGVMSANWYVYEDGVTGWPGCNVINRPQT
jgi:hypothetical protein